MDEKDVADYIGNTFAGVETMTTLGYTFFFYGPDRMLPFATIATADNEGDRVSNLDRPGVFRLNIGVRKPAQATLMSAPTILPRWTRSCPTPTMRRSRGSVCSIQVIQPFTSSNHC
jgi:Family of unknown function (DUF6194)